MTKKAGRPRIGSVWLHGDHFDIQITLPDGSRSKRGCLEPGFTKTEARRKAAHLTRIAAKTGGVLIERPHVEEGELTDKYAERWLKSRRDPKEQDNHLRKHILPLIWNRTMQDLTRADVERIVASLDAKVRAGEISWKTAMNVWGTLGKMLDDATNGKLVELRVLTRDPARDVRGPDRGEDKQSAYLFPREAAHLFACERVPERWRHVYAIALYTGLRAGELAVLRVADVVLEGGYFSVHKARDRVTGGTKSTKGKRARRVPIEPHLRPLLERLTHDEQGRAREADALLVDMPPKQKLADELRVHLARAGVDREELHASDDLRRPLSFHDLRHTFATWLALSGASELQIQTRLGHASAEMTQRYIAEAEAFGHGDIGEPFGPLPGSFAPSFAPADPSAGNYAGWTGLEPAASGVTGRRYNQLNYHPSGIDERSEATRSEANAEVVGGTGFEPATSGL